MTKRKTRNEFIDQAHQVHGVKYDYSSATYYNSSEKVSISCKEHGLFYQSPRDHLTGRGCPCCGKLDRAKSKIKTAREEFIHKARRVHENTYDYDLESYVKATKVMKILCPIHGEFEQTPNTHLSGSGCQKCARENLSYSWRSSYCNDSEKVYLYVVGLGEDVVKVGITKNLRERLLRLASYFGGSVRLIRIVRGDCNLVWHFEKNLHTSLKHLRTEGLDFRGFTECYPKKATNLILNIIENHIQ